MRSPIHGIKTLLTLFPLAMEGQRYLLIQMSLVVCKGSLNSFAEAPLASVVLCTEQPSCTLGHKCDMPPWRLLIKPCGLLALWCAKEPSPRH